MQISLESQQERLLPAWTAALDKGLSSLCLLEIYRRFRLTAFLPDSEGMNRIIFVQYALRNHHL